ncbi:MAG: glycosyltransferase [Planctomycetota bacterium]
MSAPPSTGPGVLRLGLGVCALNEAEALPRLLARVQDPSDAADRADLVVVADGGSTDGTPDLVRARGATVLATGRGRGLQLRAAAERLLEDGAEVLLFLHADGLPRLGALRVLRAALGPEGDPSCDAVAMAQVIDAPARVYRWIERAADARANRGMVYGDSGLAVRARLYRESGGFRDLPLFEDVDLSKRLRRRTRIRVLPDAELVVSPRRWREEGVLRCTARNWMLRGLFECGVPPSALERLYRPGSGRRAP